eukprot:10195746-Alexandrium_andersonii.AAC.1
MPSDRSSRCSRTTSNSSPRREPWLAPQPVLPMVVSLARQHCSRFCRRHAACSPLARAARGLLRRTRGATYR